MKTIPLCGKCSVKRAEKACRVKGGRAPKFCPTTNFKQELKSLLSKYQEPANLEFARQASKQEASCYINRHQKPYILQPAKSRMQELYEFAKRMQYQRLGLAFCGGLEKEAAVVQKILENKGFEVASVACKVGCVPKEEIGISDEDKIRQGEFEAMCNPIAQAEVLNEAETDFNIMLGLCVGHDSLFIKQSRAPVTVLAVKDRVTAHNPLAAIYTIDSYAQKLMQIDE